MSIRRRRIVLDARQVRADSVVIVAAVDGSSYARVDCDDSLYTGGVTVGVFSASMEHAMGLVARILERVVTT